MKITNYSNGHSHDHGGGGDGGGNIRGEAGAALQNLSNTHAKSYLMSVKQIFQNQTEKYDMFLATLRDFQAKSIGTAGVRERVKELFKGHGDLVSGFNAFLPKSYEITPDEYEAPPKKVVDYEEALDFVHKIEERFQDDDHVYLSFRDILYMFHSGSKDITEVYMEVSSLLRNHPDLLEEFTRFFPNDSTTPVQHARYGQNLAQCFNEQSSTTIIKKQLQLDKELPSLQQHRQQDRLITSDDHNLSIHSSKLDDSKAMIKEHEKQVEESRDRRVHDRNEREADPSNNWGLKCVPENKKSVKKAEAIRLTADFPSYNKDTLKGMYDQAFSFREKVKERLGSSDKHQAFLWCLHMFSGGIINRHDLNDLLFVSESFGSDGQLFRSSKLEDKYRDQKREVHVSKEREENHEKYMGISIHELDLRDCGLCGVSYRRLPEDYPISIPSQRSKLDAEVLNDYWRSVPSGSEEYPFKHVPRNQYEEKLFQCEDDRLELDLLIERVMSTAERTEELYNSITENKINIEGPIRIEERFSVLHLRCIENLYGEHGLEVIEALRKNPIVALPVMLDRLKQKLKEWRKCRSEFNRVWADVYATNYKKSLDYRSFYFKQQDSKNLSRKSLVAEIKEIKEKKQKQKYLQATAAGNKLSPVPHMQFEYSDVGIHEDLYKLFRYACKEIVSSKGLLNKMLRVWKSILGVTSRYAKVSDFSKQYVNNAQGDYDFVAKSQSNVSTVELQRCDVATPDPLANGVLIQSNNKEEFSGQCQVEKEEGEISPSLNDDSEEDIENSSEGGEGMENDGIDDKAKVERMRNAQSTADGSLLESSFLSVKPLTKYVSSVLLEERRESRVIYGNDDFYVLLRLHHILYERILFAKTNSKNAEMKSRIAKDANSPDPYSRFMNALYNLLGGSVDAKFEDECQAIFGNRSYMLFTLDKLIHKLVKQLQVVANVEINNKLLQLFEYENSQKPERLTHSVYLANARVILPEENIYRLECSSGPSNLFIWLMDSTNGMPKGFTLDPDCADYLYNDFLSVFPVKEEPHGFMLQRNKRKCGASDEFPDMEGVKIINKLDHVIDCNSSKVKYAPFTEDVYYRPRKKLRKWSKHNKARVERFHRFLTNCEGTAPR